MDKGLYPQHNQRSELTRTLLIKLKVHLSPRFINLASDKFRKFRPLRKFAVCDSSWHLLRLCPNYVIGKDMEDNEDDAWTLQK
jgi:hypothetical protein